MIRQVFIKSSPNCHRTSSFVRGVSRVSSLFNTDFYSVFHETLRAVTVAIVVLRDVVDLLFVLTHKWVLLLFFLQNKRPAFDCVGWPPEKEATTETSFCWSRLVAIPLSFLETSIIAWTSCHSWDPLKFLDCCCHSWDPLPFLRPMPFCAASIPDFWTPNPFIYLAIPWSPHAIRQNHVLLLPFKSRAKYANACVCILGHFAFCDGWLHLLHVFVFFWRGFFPLHVAFFIFALFVFFLAEFLAFYALKRKALTGAECTGENVELFWTALFCVRPPFSIIFFFFCILCSCIFGRSGLHFWPPNLFKFILYYWRYAYSEANFVLSEKDKQMVHSLNRTR